MEIPACDRYILIKGRLSSYLSFVEKNRKSRKSAKKLLTRYDRYGNLIELSDEQGNTKHDSEKSLKKLEKNVDKRRKM